MKQELIILDMIEQNILQIDSDGVIWRVKKKHKEWGSYRECVPHKLGHNTHGYTRIGIRDTKGRNVHAFAHRLVWMFYNGFIPEELQVNHIDGVKTNNKLDNLELVTASEQMFHAVNVLGRKVGNHTHIARHFKLSEKDVNDILRLLSEGLTQKEVAKKFNVTPGTISARIRRVV
jgi:hypothetical protein